MLAGCQGLSVQYLMTAPWCQCQVAAFRAVQVPSCPVSSGAAPWDQLRCEMSTKCRERGREGESVCAGRIVLGCKGSDLFAGWREELRIEK